MAMDGGFFCKHSTGSIMAHCANDLAAVQLACGMGMVAAVDALVMTVAAITFMAFIDLKLTIFALLPMPLLALATRHLTRKLHNRFNKVQEQFSHITEFTRSSIVAIRLLKSYTLEKVQENRFAHLGREYVDANIKVARVQGFLFPVATLVGSCGMLLVLFFGGRLVMNKVISLGDFVAFVTYLYMLVWPMMAVGWVTNLAQRGMTSLRRIHTLLDSTTSLPKGNTNTHPSGTNINLSSLSFSYPGSSKRILHSISLEIQPGILGVTGPTGCGKTTFCRMLARLYPVQNNTYIFGGVDVNQIAPEIIQSHISYVSQEAFLFSSTVAENIGFGNPDAKLEDIRAAARAACIHDEIQALPEGYESRVGERGVTLSGGQRQRIALARALLCDRPILLMDDGLAAVDTQTEQNIIDNIVASLAGKTVVWVSQRVKQLAESDRLLVLDKGKVSDYGTYQELIHKNSFLQEISRRQLLQNDLEKTNYA